MGLPGNADVAELVDALDLGSSAERRGGSSPFIRTTLSEALAKGGPEPSTLSGASKALMLAETIPLLHIRCT